MGAGNFARRLTATFHPKLKVCEASAGVRPVGWNGGYSGSNVNGDNCGRRTHSLADNVTLGRD